MICQQAQRHVSFCTRTIGERLADYKLQKQIFLERYQSLIRISKMMKFLLAAFSLHVLLSFAECLHVDSWRRESVVDTGDYIEICRQAPIELAIVLDSSSSIRHKDFQTGITFLQEFLENFDVGSGSEGVRVSIITYGRGIYPEDGFNLTTHNTKENVLAAISQIPHRAGLYTDTGKAIIHMHTVQLAPGVVRPEAEKISIVITDGNSQDWRLTKKAAEDARADNITVFAVGVGSGVRDEELLNIAGDINRVTKVENYDQLSSIKKTLASKTCIRREKPTTTPQPKIQKCGELNPTDVNFVFSPASLGLDATAWTTSFISHTINEQELDVGFRFGAVTGSCPDDEGFNLNAYNTVEEYQERLESYERNYLPQLVKRLLKDGFSEERGGRADADKVAVLVASGDGRDDDELTDYVQQLTVRGITVYIADPTGEGVNINGAVTLSGRSSRQQSETLATLLCP